MKITLHNLATLILIKCIYYYYYYLYYYYYYYSKVCSVMLTILFLTVTKFKTVAQVQVETENKEEHCAPTTKWKAGFSLRTELQ